ncbi:hypothetical protein [Nocardia sp. NPDC127526]|uniref:hypothetical protein n=1 Tax=Nocardia sp. NPDC127526 TaxID=3345393 RepID=UPI003631752D
MSSNAIEENRRGAAQARTTLHAHHHSMWIHGVTSPIEEDEDQLREQAEELLKDVMHLIRLNGLDFAEILMDAAESHAEEWATEMNESGQHPVDIAPAAMSAAEKSRSLADHARVGVSIWARTYGVELTNEILDDQDYFITIVGDFIANLGHLADRHEHDFVEVLIHAAQHFGEEIAELEDEAVINGAIEKLTWEAQLLASFDAELGNLLSEGDQA